MKEKIPKLPVERKQIPYITLSSCETLVVMFVKTAKMV